MSIIKFIFHTFHILRTVRSFTLKNDEKNQNKIKEYTITDMGLVFATFVSFCQ